TRADDLTPPGSAISFFSSRRRHTRSKRDWSSDVCSSDLLLPGYLLLKLLLLSGRGCQHTGHRKPERHLFLLCLIHRENPLPVSNRLSALTCHHFGASVLTRSFHLSNCQSSPPFFVYCDKKYPATAPGCRMLFS